MLYHSYLSQFGSGSESFTSIGSNQVMDPDPHTVCLGSLDPFYIVTYMYKMGQDSLDTVLRQKIINKNIT